MDRKNDNDDTDLREAIDDEPTSEQPVLDPGSYAAAASVIGTQDNVVDPNVLALRRVDAEIRRLMESWVDLENRLNEREAEICRLRDRGRAAEDDIKAARAELNASRTDCERLRGEAVDQRALVEAEKRQKDELRAQADQLQQSLKAARNQVDELSAEIERGNAGRDELEAQLTEYRDAVEGLASQLQKFEKASHGHDDEKATLGARIADMESQQAELTKRCRNAEAASRHMEKQLHAATDRAEGLEGELRRAQDALAKLEQKLEEGVAVSARLTDLQRELGAERDSAAALRKQLKGNEQAIAQVEAALEHQLKKTEAAVNATSRAEQLLAERDATIAGLHTRLGERDADRARLVAEQDALREQLSAVDSEFQVKRKAIAALGTEFDRIGMIQANVRKLDSMMSRQLAGGGGTAAEPVAAGPERPRNNTRLIVSLDGERAEKYPLFKPDMVIGRARDTDIRVAGPHTSRRHARVYIDDGVVMIEDLDSLNGITVNDQAVRRHELHDGDVLDVGGARLRYVDLQR